MQGLVVALHEVLAGGIRVDGPRQRRLETDEMRAALDRVDVVGEGIDALAVAFVPLQRDLGLDAVALALDVDHVVERRLRAAQVLDELDDTAAILELVVLAVALVLNGDLHTLVQEGELAQALRENVEAEVEDLEDERVGLEGDLGPALLCRAGLAQLALRLPALEALEVYLAVALDLDLEVLRERVYDRDADAVQTARDAIRAFVELASVELRQHDLGRRDAFRRMDVDRYAAAVIFDCDAVLDVNRDVDAITMPNESLVDRVVDDLEYEVVQPALTGVTDVHPGPLLHGLETLQHLDVVGAVGRAIGHDVVRHGPRKWGATGHTIPNPSPPPSPPRSVSKRGPAVKRIRLLHSQVTSASA